MDRRVLEDLVIPAGHGHAIEVKQGQVLRLEQIEGKQAADCTFYNLHDFKEMYHAGQTVALNMLAGVGSMRRLKYLYSKPPRDNLMMTVLEDTLGVHFAWNGGRCSRKYYVTQHGIDSGHRSCQDNLAEAIAPWGLTGDDVFDVLNAFMNTDVVDESKLVFKTSLAKPGDYLDLRAEMDILAAISACPSDQSPTNDYRAKPLRLQLWEPSE